MHVNPNDIHADLEGVPQQLDPLLWIEQGEGAEGVERNMKKMERRMARLDRHLPPETFFDEVALMLPSPNVALAVRQGLRAGGWTQFNEASDVVYTNPFGTRYSVYYSFYRHPDVKWRLELMQLGGGISPLHTSLARTMPAGAPGVAVAHFSFKPPALWVTTLGSRRAYSATIDYLRGQDVMHAQTCQSTYGAFSYWTPNIRHDKQLYLKPRVNLRDAGVGE